jgi:hypothetical protein
MVCPPIFSAQCTSMHSAGIFPAVCLTSRYNRGSISFSFVTSNNRLAAICL